MSCSSCTSARLCDLCCAGAYDQLRGVAARRGEAWAEDVARTVRRDQPWPTGSEKMFAIAMRKVEDLARDDRLRSLLATEAAAWAARWWARTV